MKIYLYSNSSAVNEVNKVLTLLKETECTVKTPFSLESPVFRLVCPPMDVVSRCNYFYIPEMHRYFHVTSRTVQSGSCLEIGGKTDGLMSFASEVKNVVAMIERQEFVFNDYEVDSNLPIRTESIVDVETKSKVGEDNYFVYITCTGGESSEVSGGDGV